ncbi:MAG: hypothetical protein PHT12_02305 [Patescibacteria group bacterium]|nr:hypothetical protein [Patescibacteria group bacterium]
MTRHPHAYTLDLLRLTIDRLPPTFSAVSKKEYEARLEKFLADPKADYDEIVYAIAALGKESWAERQAYEELYRRYGRSSEEAHLIENLDEGVRAKFEQFIHEGGKLNYLETMRTEEQMREPSPFERYFTPEEKYAIQQALLKAREAAHKEIDGLVADGRREEFLALAQEYSVQQKTIESRLEELRGLARVTPKWEQEILDKVRTFEEGWSVVERGVNESQVEKEVEYWKGQLEAFLQA